MDIVTILRFVHDHNDKVIGTLVALFLVTSILLLIRSIGEKSEADNLAAGGPGVDLKAIEGAMKKVLASQPVSVVAAPAGVSAGAGVSEARAHEDEPHAQGSSGGGADPAELERLSAEIEAREQKIAALTRDLNVAIEASKAAPVSSGGGADPELQAKLADLQARLAEYEIIEDDIADLSLFKEENAKLKAEVEALKEQLANAAASAPAAPASKVRVENESNLKFEATDRFELDPNDDIMKEFAAAVEDRHGPAADMGIDLQSADLSQFLAQETPAPTAKTMSPEEEAQAKIDAMFASATADVAPAAPAAKTLSPEEEAQAKIDAMFASATADVAPEPAAPKAKALSPEEEAQAKIDAMFATATADVAPEPMVPVASAGGEEVAFEAASNTASDVDDLLGSVDTAKMLSEVENLEDASGDDGDALAESLDTDRLLAEVQTLDGETSEAEPASVAAHAGPAVATETAAAAEAAPPVIAGHDDVIPVDDLLAEFEDESKT